MTDAASRAEPARPGPLSRPDLEEVLSPGRGAVVTGAASGLGLAAARRLAARGLRLVLADLREAALLAAAERIRSETPDAEVAVLAVDVADPEAVARLRDLAFETLADVSFLMNNAGAAPGGGPLGPLDGWRRVLEVNLFGVVHGVQAFLPEMIARGRTGLVVNTGSKQGITTPPGDTAYNVSKAGVRVLTEALEHQLHLETSGRLGARLFVPGFVWTGMTSRGRETQAAPAGAWTPEATVDFLFERLRAGDFYILCPDGETTPEMDRRRILWSAGDLVEGRPPLSRWRADHREAFEAWMRGSGS